MKAREPTSIEPTGAPSPFEKQNITESKPWVSSFTGTPKATAALKIRAPSKCTGMPRSSANSKMRRASSGG